MFIDLLVLDHGSSFSIHSHYTLHICKTLFALDKLFNGISKQNKYNAFTKKNGKQQTRRIAIAPNNRAIYITPNRPQGRVMSMLKGKSVSDNASGTSLPAKEIDLSMVVRMQLGQQSRRFERAR